MTAQMDEQRHPVVTPHLALGDGSVDADHDRQRLAHLQRAPDHRVVQLPRMDHAGRRPAESLARNGDPGVASAIAWHFAAMWTLLFSYLLFVAWGIVTGHFRRDFLQVGPRSVMRDFIAALRFRLAHRLGEYNAVQKAAYWGALAAIAVMILSGIAIWKPVQTYPLKVLFGGFQGARIVHFIVMAGIVLFLLVHVALDAAGATHIAGDGGRPCHRASSFDRDGERSMTLARRRMMRGGLSLGALTLLTGCDLSNDDAVQRVLARFSEWNDRVQAALFSQNRLAPTFPEGDGGEGLPLQRVVRAGEGASPLILPSYRLQLCRSHRRQAAVDDRRIVCSAAGQPGHAPCLRRGLEHDRQVERHAAAYSSFERIGADTSVHAMSASSARTVITRASTCRPRCIRRPSWRSGWSDEILPTKYGYPFKVRIPTKLGFKNPKFVTAILRDGQAAAAATGTDRGYNWLSGI